MRRAALLWRPALLRPVQRRLSSAAPSASSPTLSELLEQNGLPTSAVPATADPAAVGQQLRFLKTLGVPSLSIAVDRDPQLLTRDPRSSEPNVEYLLSLGVTDVGGIVGRCPQMLTCDVNADLHRKVAILHALGVRRIARFVEKNPNFALLDVDTELRKQIEYLRTLPGLDLGKVFDIAPTVFGRDQELVQAVAEYLVDEIRVPQDRVGKTLNKYPQLLAMRVDAIQSKVEWFRSVGIEDVTRLIMRHPRVLGCAVATLQEKHDFIVNVWKRDVQQIAGFPQALTYSFDFLRKRHGFLHAAGKADQGRLHRLLRTADQLFATKLAGRTVEEYQRFVAPASEDDIRSLDEMLASAAPSQVESALDKHVSRRTAELESDKLREEELHRTRRAVRDFFSEGLVQDAVLDSSPAQEVSADAKYGDSQVPS